MQFYKYPSLWSLVKQNNLKGFFSDKVQFLEFYASSAELQGNPFAYRRGMLERLWEGLERPYYNIFPAIVPMLLNLRLDIPCSMLRNISIEPIEVRLPEDADIPGLVWAEGRIKSLLMGIQPVVEDVGADHLIPGLVMAYDIGEIGEDGCPVLSFHFFPLRDDMTIEDAAKLLPAHESAGQGIVVPEEVRHAIIRLCACIALIDSDSDIITPDILNRDKDKWENASESHRAEILKRSKDRGKFGWNIGATIEYAPHFRRPHPALVRVGKGRTLTRIVMRKGSVVHRGKLTSVPSGFEGDSDEQTLE